MYLATIWVATNVEGDWWRLPLTVVVRTGRRIEEGCETAARVGFH